VIPKYKIDFKHMETAIIKSELEITSDVPANKAQALLEVFEPFNNKSAELIEKAGLITVNGEDDTVGMKAARDLAKEFVAEIKELDAVHKREKHVARQVTDAVDGLRKQIKDKLTATKDQLRYLADTAKRAEEERRQKLAADRMAKLSQYLGPNDYITADLGTMDDDTFGTILEGQKAKKEAAEQQAKIEALEREKAARDAKEERQQEIEAAKEKARQEERDRLKDELEAAKSPPPVSVHSVAVDTGTKTVTIQTAQDLARELLDKYIDAMDGDLVEYLESYLG